MNKYFSLLLLRRSDDYGPEKDELVFANVVSRYASGPLEIKFQ